MIPKQKKGVMNQIISIFVIILVVSILAGLTFLFVASMKTQIATQTLTPVTVVNETGWVNSTGYTLDGNFETGFQNLNIILVVNGTTPLTTLNYTATVASNNSVFITNATAVSFNVVNFTYSYSYYGSTGYKAINATESAGFQTVNYLPLIFLALIFAVILTVVLRIILPYVNLGQNLGSNGF